MRVATPEETADLDQRHMRTMSPVLTALLAAPGIWHHISLNEWPTGDASGYSGTLKAQMEGLCAEADMFGRTVIVDEKPGHREGGFFAVLR